MGFAILGEKSSQNADSFRVLRDEKNRQVCLITERQG